MSLVMQFPRIVFDFGALKALPGELKLLGVKRPLIVTDKGLAACGALERVTSLVPHAAVFGDIPENPTFEGVERAYEAYLAGGCDGVVALGGGSVIDAAKLVAVTAGHKGKPRDYIGQSAKITASVAPLVVIPTTAGTGSEASPGAGIHPDGKTRAVGTETLFIVPKLAICDPELTLTLPPRLTAGTGLDALSHCVEGYLSKKDNPALDAIALDGIKRVFANLRRAVENGQDREARKEMMMAALQGGMAIHKGLGPAHAIANTLGDRGFHHGVLCTLALPISVDLMGRHVPEKLGRIAEMLELKSGGGVGDAIRDLNAKTGIAPHLGAMGFGKFDLAEAAGVAEKSPFNHTSPYAPTRDEFQIMLAEVAG